MAKTYSLLFPGQGSQYVGMGQSFFASSMGMRLADEASAVLGFSLKQIMLEGTLEELTNTAIAQPAILLHSIMAFRQANLNACSFLGHSLGEYSALVAAGVMPFSDAIHAVHLRGKLMQEAVPRGQGAMAAVLGLDVQKIHEALQPFSDEASDDYAAVANFNEPSQTVIAGTAQGVQRAGAALKEAGARRILELSVSAPFHCALMKPVQKKMGYILQAIPFQNAQVPIISNVSAKPEHDGERIKDLLLEQIASPVRFVDCARSIKEHRLSGDGFVELGPKNILCGLMKKIDPEASLINIDTYDDLTKLREQA